MRIKISVFDDDTEHVWIDSDDTIIDMFRSVECGHESILITAMAREIVELVRQLKRAQWRAEESEETT